MIIYDFYFTSIILIQLLQILIITYNSLRPIAIGKAKGKQGKQGKQRKKGKHYPEPRTQNPELTAHSSQLTAQNSRLIAHSS